MILLGGALMASCSAPDIEGTLWRCNTQADCGAGFVCAEALGACVKPDNSADGVSSDKIVLGMSAPLSAGASTVGEAYVEGVEAYFAAINAQGGVDGRELELKVMDDGGDPARAHTNIQSMVEGKEVFAVFGGTHGTQETVDFMNQQQRIFFAPVSGSPALFVDPPDRYVFKMRGSAREDVGALVNYALNDHPARVSTNNVAVFAESGSGGMMPEGVIGVDATRAAIEASGREPGEIFAATHASGSLDMDEAVGQTLQWLAAGRTRSETGGIFATVVLSSHAVPSATFVRELLDELFKIKRGTSVGADYELTQEEAAELLNVQEVLFLSPSTVDMDKLTVDLKTAGTYQTLAGEVPYCTSIVASRAVPPVDSNASGVLAYKTVLENYDATAQPGHIGFEGYLAARLLVEAFRRNGPALDTEKVVSTLENLSLDLGLGEALTFSPSDRVALNGLYGARFGNESCEAESLEFGEPPVIDEPDPTGCEGGVCVLTGTITEDTILTADQQWLLRGSVFVGSGNDDDETVLTIEPGTTILGDSETVGVLIVRRGSKVVAEGTREAPIVFTSSKAPGTRAAGDWGGIILNGRAPINGCDSPPCEAFGEGGTGFFGGDRPEDSSGTLRYVRVEFAGRLLSPDNELNGLALQGVGSETVLEYIQIHRGADDGVEFFGGTANFKYILTTGMEDDNLDWTLGWQGKGQYFIAQQWSGFGDNGIEGDNNEDDRDALPRSQPTLCNLTLVGSPQSDKSDYGMLLREGTAGNLSSVVVAGWNDACLDIDHPETFQNAQTDGTPTGELLVSRSVFDCSTNFEENNEDVEDAYSVSSFIVEMNEANLLESAGLREPFDTVSPDFRPGDGSPALSGGACPEDPFFEASTFRGGMDPDEDWTLGWTTNVEN